MSFIEIYAAFAACIATPLAILLLCGEYAARWRWLDSVAAPVALLAWLLGLGYIMSVS